MAKGNILKEAIADAKAVREVALANAKAALEEAFTPKLQSMFSAKLSQTLDESEEEEEVELDEMTGMDDEDTIEEMDMYDEDMMDMMENKKGGCGCKKENTQLQETKRAYDHIKTELNEVNLLNSKLLYVNRIFKANNLNEAQKLRVVETLDNASNIKEAKLIYETIKDTFTISKEKKITPKKSIRENFGMASKAAGTSTAPKKPVLNESNDMVSRMQKLANISKIK